MYRILLTDDRPKRYDITDHHYGEDLPVRVLANGRDVGTTTYFTISDEPNGDPLYEQVVTTKFTVPASAFDNLEYGVTHYFNIWAVTGSSRQLLITGRLNMKASIIPVAGAIIDGAVTHGTTATTARPDVNGSVTWTGAVYPDNFDTGLDTLALVAPDTHTVAPNVVAGDGDVTVTITQQSYADGYRVRLDSGTPVEFTPAEVAAANGVVTISTPNGTAVDVSEQFWTDIPGGITVTQGGSSVTVPARNYQADFGPAATVTPQAPLVDGTVTHGTDRTVARPSVTGDVTWTGVVYPDNFVTPGDTLDLADFAAHTTEPTVSAGDGEFTVSVRQFPYADGYQIAVDGGTPTEYTRAEIIAAGGTVTISSANDIAVDVTERAWVDIPDVDVVQGGSAVSAPLRHYQTSFSPAASVTPAAAGAVPATLTVDAFNDDQNVFDSGAAFNRNAASITVTGTADGAGTFPVRAVVIGGGTASPEVDVTVAGAESWEATLSVPRNAAWLRAEAQQQDGTWVPMAGGIQFASGHVIGVMGQSELDRLFITTGGSYGGTLNAGTQFTVVVGDATYGGSGLPGNPVTDFSVTRGFIDTASGIASKMQHTVDMMLKNGVDVPVAIIDLSQSAHGRFQLSDDVEPNRRWQDFIACLDGAGWQDGVRPGVLIDMWTNADVRFATDFVKAYKPFYCGLNADGTDYTLGDNITVETFPGQPGTDDVVIKHDHILFDLSGNGQGIFDPAVTKIALCHHRYDPFAADQQSAFVDTGGDAVTDMWAQEILAETFDDMLADTDLSQIMERGTEPMNYENGSETAGGSSWGDQIHPGQGDDGLQLFARHIGHAALRALNVVSDTVPEFDTVVFDPAGAYADFSSTAGDITTTRKLRGEADPSPEPGTHWTDVFGFEFNDMPVQRAELQPDGSVRVYVPDTQAPADWTRDRFFFGRGGGSGVLLPIDDPLEGAWKNYPVVDAADLSISGMYDDQSDTSGGIAVRRLGTTANDVSASDAYRGAAVNTQNAWFRDPDGVAVAVGADATQLHLEMDVAFHSTQKLIRLMGLADDVDFFINRTLEIRTAVWAGGGGATSSNFTPVPNVRYRLKLVVDRVANTLRAYANDTLIIDDALGGSAVKFIDGAQINCLGNTDNADGDIVTPDAEFISFRAWVNENVGDVGDSTPVTTPYKEILASDGVAALDADPWRQPGGTIVPFDQAPVTPGQIDITSEAEMRTFLADAAADPTITDGLTVSLAAGLDLTGIEGSAWQDVMIDNPAQEIMTIKSVVPFNPARLRLVPFESSVPGDGKVIGGVAFEDIRFDLTNIPLDVPEEDNTQAQVACLTHSEANLLRRVRIKRNYFVGSNIDFRIDNREPINRLVAMNFNNAEDLEVSGNLFDLMSSGGIVGGSDVLVTRNEFKRCNEDFWRISRPNIGGVGFGCTNYRVIENVFHDSWSRFRLHPDFVQVDDYHNTPDADQQLEFEIDRNVVWLGDGMYCPVSPSGYGQDAFVMWDTLPATMPMTNERVNRIRQMTAGTTTLDTGAAVGTQMAIQLEAGDTLYEPITIEPGVGQNFIMSGSGAPLTNVVLIRPNQTVEFTVGANGVITVQEFTCDNNMVQSNYSANKGTIRGKMRNNIWATNGSISARLGSNWVDGSVVDQNTMMQVRPGDVTGDGVPNTHADGWAEVANNPKIVIETSDGSATGNIVYVVNNPAGGATANNRNVNWDTPSEVTDVFPLVTVENGGLKNFPTDLQDMVARALTISAAATAAKQGAGWDTNGDAVGWAWTDDFGSGPDLALGNGSVVGGSGPQFAAAA